MARILAFLGFLWWYYTVVAAQTVAEAAAAVVAAAAAVAAAPAVAVPAAAAVVVAAAVALGSPLPEWEPASTGKREEQLSVCQSLIHGTNSPSSVAEDNRNTSSLGAPAVW